MVEPSQIFKATLIPNICYHVPGIVFRFLMFNISQSGSNDDYYLIGERSEATKWESKTCSRGQEGEIDKLYFKEI